MQLYVLGTSGSINLPYGAPMVNLCGQLMIIPAPVSHLLALVPGVVILMIGLRTRVRRQAANLSAPSVGSVLNGAPSSSPCCSESGRRVPETGGEAFR